MNEKCRMNNTELVTAPRYRSQRFASIKSWPFIFYSTLFILHSSFLQAQIPLWEQLAGTWIGVCIEYDQHFNRPYPVCMKLGADSAYAISLIDEGGPGRQSTWGMTGQKIRLDTNSYTLGQWSLRGDELRLMGVYPILFRRFTNVAIDSAAARQTLTGYSWLSDSLTYHFHADGSACVENPNTGDVAIHCWRLAQVGKSIFLVLKGNRTDCDGNFQYPVQITQLTLNKAECLSGNGRGIESLTFRRGAALKLNQPCQPKGFQPCNAYAFSSFNLYPYFSYRRGRLFAIQHIVEREYKPVSLPGQSGLIRFKFMVNCQGEAGRFEMLTVDENYQKCQFDKQITNQLLTICRTKLTDWEPGQTNDTHTPVDTFCLLTFRLKDGHITEIFP